MVLEPGSISKGSSRVKYWRLKLDGYFNKTGSKDLRLTPRGLPSDTKF